jgi:MFS family permease
VTAYTVRRVSTPHPTEPPTLHERSRRPWWIPHFLGGVPDIEPRLLTLLGLVSLAIFFEQYDLSMLTSALKFIAADLGMAEADLGRYTSLMRLGALPAFVIIPFADRIGRRRLFLISVVGTSVATLLTALSQTATQFVAYQIVMRTFLVTGLAVTFVIVAEEFPAAHRGWAIGMLGALGACGQGLGAAVFAAIHYLPYGWRGLYLIGIVPLLMLPRFRRGVHETARFERHRDRHAAAHDDWSSPMNWLQPLIELARRHPLRAMGIGAVGILGPFGSMAVFQFIGYFTQTVHGWEPWRFSVMVLLGGGIGIIGNVAAGRLGDRFGRRIVGLVFMSVFPAFVWIFYGGPGWSLPLAWTVLVFCATASDVVVRALSTELFPTSHRSAAAGWLSFVSTVGAAASLGIVGLWTRAPGDLARMISLLSLSMLAAGAFLLLLPETSRRELETISPDAV